MDLRGIFPPVPTPFHDGKADLLVAVGARFDDRVTGKLAAFAPGATVVHLDIDSAEISKLRQADIPAFNKPSASLTLRFRAFAVRNIVHDRTAHHETPF